MFKNQFISTSEGLDGDDTYWDNNNLTFAAQTLSTFAAFNAAFPRKNSISTEQLFNTIAGDLTLFYKSDINTYAIRLSRGLNYSGVNIPYLPGRTYKGSDDKYYFKAAYEINLWMRKTFGTNDGDPNTPHNPNHYKYTGAEAGVHGVNLPGLLAGKKGIYSIYSSDFRWASGHADLLMPDATCGNDCHFYDAPILRLDIWVLQ